VIPVSIFPIYVKKILKLDTTLNPYRSKASKGCYSMGIKFLSPQFKIQKMKKLFFLGTLLFAFVCTTFAQTDNQPMPVSTELKKGRGKAQAQGNNVKKTLGLSDDQATKMKDAKATLQGKMKAIKSDTGLSKEQKKAQIKDAAMAFDGQIKGIFTPEQYTKWGEMKQKMKGKMKENRKGKKGLKQEDDNMELPDDGQ
jgi:periplasmic protein CpxP/Spy